MRLPAVLVASGARSAAGVRSLATHGARFSELRRRLPDISDRSLSEALVDLEATRLADRGISTGRAPTVEDLPTDGAGELRRLLIRLVAA
jgi:DNA-binding HxlR family transcriptional regulator